MELNLEKVTINVEKIRDAIKRDLLFELDNVLIL
jgi:hypothetical protein